MFDTRLICLPDQSYTHVYEHHQLMVSLAGHVKFEVNGCGGEVCRMRACLVSGETGHMFAGVSNNRVLTIDLGEGNPALKDPDLLARLLEAPCYPAPDADFQNPLDYAGAELARYGSDPLLTRVLGGVLVRVLYLHLFGGQQPLATSGSFDPERLDAHIVRNLARHITIAELVRVACLNPSHLHAQFKNSVDLTPHQYLFEIHLGCAARLLREGRLSLVRIIEECGFPGQSALTMAVCRCLGLIPRSLRRD